MAGLTGLTITSARLRIDSLRVEDADEMVAVLGDERLHEFTGGRPATLAELRTHYARLLAGSPRTDEVWLNWIVRRRSDSQPVGTVQATLRDGGKTALVAWVIGVDWQKQGLASEAARALVDCLREHRVHQFVARIHPAHVASGAVAARAGLEPTEEEIGGEQVWRSS
jgi:RimJ/RimL family protein N-acetyltransferase